MRRRLPAGGDRSETAAGDGGWRTTTTAIGSEGAAMMPIGLLMVQHRWIASMYRGDNAGGVKT
jgi:hypothetical protein